MARTINFDAVVVETIDVTKAGHTYQLRDDVPMTVMVRTFALLEHQASLRERGASAKAADAEAWLAELQAMTLRLCGDIFRHSLPEMTDDELVRLFTFEEQMQLVMLFFTNRSLKSQQQANALNASSPTTEASETAQPAAAAATPVSSATANRQQRRGAAGGTTQRKR